MMRMKTDYRIKNYDFFLIACTAALSGIGVLLIGSANQSYQVRQIAGIILGFFVMAAVSFMDYRLLSRFGWGVYAAALLPPVVLILEQPDLSTAIIVVWIFLCMLFMGGLDYKIISRAFLAAVPVCGAGLFFITRPGQILLNDNQYRRIMAWLAPQEWAQDSYQQRNSIMAIGSGGLWGKGLNNDNPLSVKNGNFLPEPHTDFIMAVAGEELGFSGCCVILLLLTLIVAECIRIGIKAKDLTGRLICIGIAALIAGQSFINLSVVTGLTLPFVSYGLTSLVSLYMGVGLVLNVGLQRSEAVR